MHRSHSLRALSFWTFVVLAAGPATQAVGQINSYVPAAGGNWSAAGNWSLGHCPIGNESPYIIAGTTAHKTVLYDWSGLSNFPLLKLDGSATHYALLHQPDRVLTTTDEQIGGSGDAWHWVEGPAFVWVNNILYVGYSGTSDTDQGHFYLQTVYDLSAGLYVGDLCYVGYNSAGEFDHQSGFSDVGRLYVGQNAEGIYRLRPGGGNGQLTVQGQFVIGNGDVGTVEQSSGTLRQIGTNGIIMGLNTGGSGTYLMRGGTVNVDHISLAWNGDAFFTQSGGTVNVTDDINIGCQGTHPLRSWYKLNQTDGTAELTVGGNLLVGVQTLGKYEQEGGTATVTGNVEIWDGSADPGASSYLYMGLNAGMLEADGLVNHSGFFDQDGGVLEVWTGVNDSPQGMNIDNNADCRIRTLTHNAGTITLWRSAILRGPYAFGTNYWICDFTNNATFQMGSVASNGGSFRGVLVNNGTFIYNQGDFSTSTLDNAGTVTLNADFTCRRLLNRSAELVIPTARWIHADGAGYPSAVENSGVLTMRAGSHLDVGTNSVANKDRMHAGGPAATPATIHGDLDNDNFLLPSDGTLVAGGQLVVTGDYGAAESAEVRIRLGGTASTEYDRLTIQGAARLAGTLDVRLAPGFVPALGDRFFPLAWASRTGYFSPIRLPALAPGLMWNVSYGSTQLRLAVVSAPACPGDLDGDDDVDISDLAVLLSNFGTPGGANPSDGDLDGDTDVDLSDLAVLLGRFGVTC